ncbi:MAG: porphobilinogen synthase [Chlamydiota bacterium]
MSPYLEIRARRNRQTPAIRSLNRETTLVASDLVAPFFVKDQIDQPEPIAHLSGIARLPLHFLMREAEKLHAEGVSAVALFPAIRKELKDLSGSEAYNRQGIIPRAIEALKRTVPSLCIIADVALDPYTSHGHDGIVTSGNTIDNDKTLTALAKQALVCADAGADILAPSATMDGRVQAIRFALDSNGFSDAAILSYTAKYASSLYAPFRCAVETKLLFGDKKTYQLNPANRREAIREALLDERAGADMLLVKPALPYLDVIAAMRAQTFLPIGAYQVSGEYAMIMAAASTGALDAQETFYELLTSIKRAGADFILTYAAKTIIDLLN